MTARYRGSAYGPRWFEVEIDGRRLVRRLWDPTPEGAFWRPGPATEAEPDEDPAEGPEEEQGCSRFRRAR